MNSNLKKELAITACKVRMGIIEGTHSAKSGHPGGSLSAADVLTYLYFCEMNVDPQQPGQSGPRPSGPLQGPRGARAVCRAGAQGIFPGRGAENPAQDRLPSAGPSGHEEGSRASICRTGSLGQGISAACGMALGCQAAATQTAASMPCWATARFRRARCGRRQCSPAHYQLDNLCVLVDNNGLQIDGNDRRGQCPHTRLMKSLRLSASMFINIDGHDFDQIEAAYQEARTVKGQPTAIIAKTVKGKGVSFMENQCFLARHGSQRGAVRGRLWRSLQAAHRALSS